MKKKFFADETGFYRQIFKLVLPIVIQNLLSAAVSSADIVMLNYVGQSSISAVSLASQYANILFMVYYGLGTGATMLCAQYFGKGDMHAIEVVEGIALRFSIVISLAFASVALLIPELMMKVFTNDQELIVLGASYLRFMSITYLCWGITEVYLSVLRSIGRVTVSMALNILAFSLNILLNAVFIFGLFGAPNSALWVLPLLLQPPVLWSLPAVSLFRFSARILSSISGLCSSGTNFCSRTL